MFLGDAFPGFGKASCPFRSLYITTPIGIVKNIFKKH
jgi:hypothetical protein